MGAHVCGCRVAGWRDSAVCGNSDNNDDNLNSINNAQRTALLTP